MTFGFGEVLAAGSGILRIPEACGLALIEAAPLQYNSANPLITPLKPPLLPSLPMVSSNEFDSLRDGVFFWQAYDPAVKVDLSCCARRTESGLVFIDPIPLAHDALEQLCASCQPAGIVLTNGNHERAARKFRDRLQIPIWGHRDAQSELGGCLDHLVEDRETIFGELSVIALPGAGAGEIALHGGGFLHLGDALIHLPKTGLGILPSKYCADFKELRGSLRKLLSFRFEALTFAHGLPIVAHGFQRISQLLE